MNLPFDHMRHLDSDAFAAFIRLANLVAFVLMSPEEHRALIEDIRKRKERLAE